MVVVGLALLVVVEVVIVVVEVVEEVELEVGLVNRKIFFYNKSKSGKRTA